MGSFCKTANHFGSIIMLEQKTGFQVKSKILDLTMGWQFARECRFEETF